MGLYRIELIGCDDTTRFDLDLDDEQAAFLEWVAERSREVSEYGCMPIMRVVGRRPPTEQGEDDD